MDWRIVVAVCSLIGLIIVCVTVLAFVGADALVLIGIVNILVVPTIGSLVAVKLADQRREVAEARREVATVKDHVNGNTTSLHEMIRDQLTKQGERAQVQDERMETLLRMLTTKPSDPVQ